MKTNILIILFLLFTSASYGQPIIDSMLVDEMKGELHIYGLFGVAPGTVSVDGVLMKIKNWSDTLISTSIPDTGKGSIGAVIVNVNGLVNIPTGISSWRGIWDHRYNMPPFSPPQEEEYAIGFSIRMDLSSMVKNNTARIFIPGKESYVYGYELRVEYTGRCSQCDLRTSDKVNIQDAGAAYNKGFNCYVMYDPSIKGFQFNISRVKGIIGEKDTLIFSQGSKYVPYEYHVADFSPTIPLDSFYQLATFDINSQKDPAYDEYSLKGRGPDSVIPFISAILKKPILISPKSESLFSYKDNIDLRWDSLPFINDYHIELATDSSFLAIYIDIIIFGQKFSPPSLRGLTKYFWRVQGRNIEGTTYWSELWNFTTGGISDVVRINNSPLSLSCFPNPISKELNILYSLPQRGNARIILHDLEGRVIRENVTEFDIGDHHLRWDVSQLPSGSYVLELITEKEQKTQIVQIVH